MSTDPARSIRRLVLAGMGVLGLLGGAVGGWAFATEFAGAVIAPGAIVVDSNVKKVHHPTGGVVGEILARDGSRVRTGDILVRLDPTVTAANLAIVVKSLHELTARRARLEAERAGEAEIRFPPALLAAAAADPDAAHAIAAERRVHVQRLAARTGRKAVLSERIEQIREEIAGHAAQVASKAEEIRLIERELAGVRNLWAQNLIPIGRLTALEREAARLGGERGQLVAAIAQARGRISQAEMEILQTDLEADREVDRELRDAESRIGELVERRVAAEDVMRRIDIRAPQDGIVHQSTVHTVGGVVPAGEALMLIVPDDDRLTAEVRIAPRDIDQLRPGQPAMLRFPAFNQRTTPELAGTVSHISADTTRDGRTGAEYFTVRLVLPQEEIARLGGLRVLPGMPVEAMLRTDDRTVISYLVKPLHDQMARAFREN